MRIFLGLSLLLCACNAPTFKNFTAPSKTVEAQGLTFKVIYTTTEAEAFRVGILLPAKFKLVRPAAIEAMEKASGCGVNTASVKGDPAKLTADLVC